MQVTLCSKNILLTDGLKDFIMTRTVKLSKYASSTLQGIQVLLDIDKKKKGSAQDAVVEMIGTVKGKRLTVRESSSTFYKAFFGAMEKMKRLLLKEKKR